MNKDVIYIDVDDDVTAVIGKIKSAKEKIVAIVPPKRPGALQSAVNLRLLDRMAKADKKQLVLISSNQALVALAANAQIPVAKNLQSKPEIAEVPALIVDDGDDVIDGGSIPVGQYAAGIKVSRNDGARDDAIETIDVENDSSFAPLTMGSAVAAKKATDKKSSGKKLKIPNFDTFRKKLFIGLAALLLLIGVLVWAFVFAPSATVVITAQTAAAPVSGTATLSTTAASNFGAGILRATAQTEKKTETIEFDATGTKDVGDKATGTVRFSTNSITNLGVTIPAGTTVRTGNGLPFTTDSSVTFTIQNYNGTDVAVTASESGTDFNGASGSVSGAPNGVSASFVGSAAGGTSRQVKVVSAADVERAQGDILGRSTDTAKKDLTAKFTGNEKVIDSSFTVNRAAAVASPAVDAESTNGKATLSIETTYVLYAVTESDLKAYLDESVKSQLLDNTTQRVYDDGYNSATLSNFQRNGDTLSAGITASGQIGPKVDEADIKERVKGKIYGDAQSAVESIEGIQSVDVQFPYFWVRTIPEDSNKINVEFTLTND